MQCLCSREWSLIATDAHHSVTPFLLIKFGVVSHHQAKLKIIYHHVNSHIFFFICPPTPNLFEVTLRTQVIAASLFFDQWYCKSCAAI